MWNTKGKITDIIRYYSTNLPSGISAPATWPPDLHFEYDASGNRVAKIVMPKDASGFPLTPDHYTKTYYLRDAQGNILSTYEDKQNDANFYLAEQNIYGSSRLGMRREEVNMTPSSPPLACAMCPVYFENSRGKKNYEMTNHLGNVLTTINDSREAVQNGNQIDYFKSVITSVTDYYPFGMNMPGRQYTSVNYRFGYNGVEQTDEVAGSMKHYEFKYREYNPLTGKFWSVDPLSKEYPWNSTYAFAENRVIDGIDLEGKEWLTTLTTLGARQTPVLRPVTESMLKGSVQTGGRVSRFTNEQLENFMRGNKHEVEQLSRYGLEKNTKPVDVQLKPGEVVRTIPDAMKNGGKSTAEVKNVRNQSLTKQLKAQEKFSNDNGFRPELIINKSAKLSEPLKNSTFDIKLYQNLTMPIDNTKVVPKPLEPAQPEPPKPSYRHTDPA